MKKLFAICLLTVTSFTVNAQSHISTGKYQCQLVPKSLNSEKYPCPACAKIAEEKRLAKVAEDKKQYQASVESAKASLAASIAASKKRQEETDKNNKVTEIGLSMSTSGSTSTSNISAQNPLSTTPATTTTTTIQETQRQAYDQAQAAKAAKAELTKQVVTQAAGLVGELVNEWNANYDKKMARWEAESKAASAAIGAENVKKGNEKFREKYLHLMDAAIKGDEQARMTLYFSSKYYYSTEFVPQRELWFEQALNNNNCDALLSVLNKEGVTLDKKISKLENMANLGCVDAMMYLADLYDLKFEGNNEQKAIAWFTKAAEKGSPNAMYSLGMIYKYGYTHSKRTTERMSRKRYIDYNVKKDEKLAFEWFKESLIPDYNSSNVLNFDYVYYKLSRFDYGTYDELYQIYNEGKIVPADKAKANEFKKLRVYL